MCEHITEKHNLISTTFKCFTCWKDHVLNSEGHFADFTRGNQFTRHRYYYFFSSVLFSLKKITLMMSSRLSQLGLKTLLQKLKVFGLKKVVILEARMGSNKR